MKQETIITFEPTDDVEPEFACRSFRLTESDLGAEAACGACAFHPGKTVRQSRACRLSGLACAASRGRYYAPA